MTKLSIWFSVERLKQIFPINFAPNAFAATPETETFDGSPFFNATFKVGQFSGSTATIFFLF